jgi:putative hemolysin
MSGEGWLESSVLVLAFTLLTMAGLVEASLIKRQRWTIRELLESGANGGNTERGVDQNDEIRSSIDVAMLVAVLIIGAAVSHMTIRLLTVPWLLAVIPGTVLLVLAAGRLVPELIVDRFSLAESSGVHRLAVFIATMMGPFMLLMNAAWTVLERNPPQPLDEFFTRRDGNDQPDVEENQENGDRGEIQHDEHEMISGILSLDEAFAREIMVPRPDIVAVALDTPVAEVVSVAQEAGHSRIPVYEDSIDRVQGIVYAKDLLRFVHDDVGSADLPSLMRPALFVPESKRVDDLLSDLQRSRVHMAIVVDEYGGTAGLVTIEDIIEEIVGEIQDEYDREVPLYEMGTEGEMTVDGRMSVDELSELIGLPLPETESETVGGLVARELGHIPEPGEAVSAGPVTIRVETVERRRVRTVQVEMTGDAVDFDSADQARAT